MNTYGTSGTSGRAYHLLTSPRKPKISPYQEFIAEMTQDTLHPKQRTGSQNKALYLHFTNIARELNNKGITQRGFYEKTKYFDMPCTKEFIHDMWLMIQEKMYKTNSTTFLKKQGQIDEINDVLMKGLGENCDIEYMPIPVDKKRQWEKHNYSEYRE